MPCYARAAEPRPLVAVSGLLVAAQLHADRGARDQLGLCQRDHWGPIRPVVDADLDCGRDDRRSAAPGRPCARMRTCGRAGQARARTGHDVADLEEVLLEPLGVRRVRRAVRVAAILRTQEHGAVGAGARGERRQQRSPAAARGHAAPLAGVAGRTSGSIGVVRMKLMYSRLTSSSKPKKPYGNCSDL